MRHRHHQRVREPDRRHPPALEAEKGLEEVEEVVDGRVVDGKVSLTGGRLDGSRCGGGGVITSIIIIIMVVIAVVVLAMDGADPSKRRQGPAVQVRDVAYKDVLEDGVGQLSNLNLVT